MDFFRVNNSDLQDLNLDKLMREIKSLFSIRGDELERNSKIGKKNMLGISFYTKRIEDIYLTQHKLALNADVAVNSNNGIQNIGLYFTKNCNSSYSTLNKNKIHKYLKPNRNSVLFMQEDTKSTEYFKSGSYKESTSIHLSVDYFKKLVNQYPSLFEESYVRYEKGESFFLNEEFAPIRPEIYHILSQIENAHLFGRGKKAYVDAKILELLCLQFQSHSDYETIFCKINNKDCDKIHEACSILLSNIHTPPSLRNLALEVGINEKKLKCGFKEVYNNTVYGYLFDYKMQLAEQLLQDTSKSIAEVALQCGYDYPSHFCTAFKRKFDVSPSILRKIR